MRESVSHEEENFMCPLTGAPMEDPVTAADGITYERHAIEAYLATGMGSSPVTGALLSHRDLMPNDKARKARENFNPTEALWAAIAQEEVELDDIAHLVHLGANLEARNEQGCNALWLAALNGHQALLDHLVTHYQMRCTLKNQG